MTTWVTLHTVARREDDFAPEIGGWETSLTEIRWQARPYPWRPPTDVFETDEAVVVRLEVAGMRPEDFRITLQDRVLVIRGVRYEQAGVRAYQQMEIRFGEFEVVVHLSWPVQAEEIEAEYRDGFLLVRLPKVRPVSVEVDAPAD